MQFDERRYRPLRTVDLFDEAFDIYKKNFVLLLGVAALVYVPLQTFLSVLFLSWARQQIGQFSGDAADPGAAFGFLFGILGRFFSELFLTTPVYLIGFALVAGALAKAVSACYLGETVTFWEAYKASFRRFPSNLVALFLDYAAIFALSFCLVGFLLPLIRWLLVTPIAVLEGNGPFKAMKRSADLGRNNDWRLLSTLTILFFLSLILYTGLEGVIEIFTGKLFNLGALAVPAIADHPQVAQQVAGGLAQLLMLPFQVAVVTLLYYDLRIRQEGYDMEILAERLGYPAVDYKTATPPVPAGMVGRVLVPPKTPAPLKKGRA